MPLTSPSLRRTVAAFGAAGLAALAVPAAHAHDVVLGATPADGATIEQFPEEVTLEFSGIPKEGFNTLAVSEAESGEVLFTGEPVVDGRNVSLPVPRDVDAGLGEYRIGFQITSSDGHSTRGMTTFTVAGDATEATPEQAPSESTEPTATENPADGAGAGLGTGATIALAVAAVLAVVAAAAAAVARNRKRNELRTNLDER